jgi:hypothetical protein
MQCQRIDVKQSSLAYQAMLRQVANPAMQQTIDPSRWAPEYASAQP